MAVHDEQQGGARRDGQSTTSMRAARGGNGGLKVEVCQRGDMGCVLWI